MRNVLGSHTILGYCTNVHAGTSFDAIRANLMRYAVPVRERVCKNGPMGVGLWFSNDAARYALHNRSFLADLKSWMAGVGLIAYTLNGFPFGDFHQRSLKSRVYTPDWANPERYNYTLMLVKVLAELLPDECEGSISTVPLGWPSLVCSGGVDANAMDRFKNACAEQLHNLIHELARIELDTGKHIHLDIEPEPGCVIDTAPKLVGFFEHHLLDCADAPSVRGYLRVCHDVCHSAVMFESQSEALAAYQAAGLHVGKVQVSSAIAVKFDDMAGNERLEAKAQLQAFAEDRYQHQTSIRLPDGSLAFYNDLPDALAANDTPQGEWRVHFHVPLYVDRFGMLETTQSDIAECLSNLQPAHECKHFEVETYAWDVLPKALQRHELADGIADELKWVRDTFGPGNKAGV